VTERERDRETETERQRGREIGGEERLKVIFEPDVMAQACGSSTWKAEAKGS
jgi:hypothetical protein